MSPLSREPSESVWSLFPLVGAYIPFVVEPSRTGPFRAVSLPFPYQAPNLNRRGLFGTPRAWSRPMIVSLLIAVPQPFA